MKKGQKTDYKKDVFQTGLTEATRGIDALKNFLGGQGKRQMLNIVRKKKKK